MSLCRLKKTVSQNPESCQDFGFFLFCFIA